MPKERKINFKVSDKMFTKFDKVLKENEETKSEVLRACIRKYIKENKR
jgi:metal-responsive CopG/Arc/MetJ family transcriptional regulator